MSDCSPNNFPGEDWRKKLPPTLSPLLDLAFNFWWSWSAQGESIFRDLDARLWEECHQKPVKFLQCLSPKQIAQFASDPTYLNRLEKRIAEFRDYMDSGNKSWASKVSPELHSSGPIAYFCFEFGVHQSLPNYAGGLGVLAGDHLKSASDLGVPMVGVGLLFRNGYLEQHFNGEGWQEERYPEYHFEQIPVELVRDASGEPLTVEITIRRRKTIVQCWQVRVGRVNIYLLDTNRPDNDPVDRAIARCLYGGDVNNRMAQEFLLGIGGVKMLQRLGITPSLYHLNEGHAAFALLELVRQWMANSGKTFGEAKEEVKERCIFTTHTPVMGGHDRFPPELMAEFFADFWPQLNLSQAEFLDLGARKPTDPWAPFNMTVLALRLTRSANGVSELNGQVAREMWSAIYPDREIGEVPIGSITNGIHSRTWIAPLLGDLYADYLDKNWGTCLCDRHIWERIGRIQPRELWQRHQLLKEQLIVFARHWLQEAQKYRGESPEAIEPLRRRLDPNLLTIGFARRFSPYKRPDLIFYDPDRAKAILGQRDRPVQLIFAGKAHPQNEESKRIMQRIIQWSHDLELQERIIFIEDYDMFIAKKLVRGVDVWLNTPRRPLEASGTSGQKVALNGGLNCSILDGWWREAYREDDTGKGINGWAIGGDRSPENREEQDRRDAESLYRLIDEEIIPLYYNRDENGVPQGWIEMMKASIKTVAPVFNTDRMLAEYVREIYLPEVTADLQRVCAV